MPRKDSGGYAYLPLALVNMFVPLAKELGVSEVARSKSGFLNAYRLAGGDPNKLADSWDLKRENFIKRHYAQMKSRGEELFDEDGYPTRRHLALIMWAWSPQPKSLK